MSIRLVLIVSQFPQLSETFIVSKFLGLLERGWDVHVVCSRVDEQAWSRYPALQARPEVRRRVHAAWPVRPRWKPALRALPALGRGLVRNRAATRRYLQAPASVAARLRRFYIDLPLIVLRPHLVHFEFGALAPGRLALKESLGCRVVVSFRGYDINFAGIDDPAYYREVWHAADALHLLGESLWRQAQRRGCPPQKPHALIPPALDLDFFDPGARKPSTSTGRPEQPLEILSVGRLSWKKGYDYALAAVRRLIDRGVACRYTIIGDGPYLPAVAFARHQLGLEAFVDLAGPQPLDAVKKHLAGADVFLHAAVSEGFGNAVLEAQAMQLPVVCSDADGLLENVADGETGFVVPRRDAEALAGKLALLARDPALRQRFGAAGRRRVEQHFRLEDQIQAFDQLYRRVLRRPAEVPTVPTHSLLPDPVHD